MNYALEQQGAIIKDKDLEDISIPDVTLPDNRPTFKEIMDSWLNFKTNSAINGHELTEHTKYVYRNAVKTLEPLYDRPIEDITISELQDLVSSLSTNWLQSIAKVTITAVYEHAQRKELNIVNKGKYILITVGKTPSKRKIISNEHISLLWQNSMYDDCAVVLIFLYTGMRISELSSLNTENAHLDEECPYVIGGVKTSAGKNRVIPICPKIYPLFVRMSHKYANNELLFPLTVDNTRRKFFHVAMNRFDLDYRPHDTRHTFITRCNELEVNDMVLKQIVGHARPGITEQVYTHRSIETLYNAVKNFDYDIT